MKSIDILIRVAGQLLLSASLALFTASCGSADSSSSPPAIAPSPAAPVTGDPAPIQLQGIWMTIAKDASQQEVILTLRERTYVIARGNDSAVGGISVHGDQIDFNQSSACNGVGTYRWSLNGNSVSFVSLIPDECPGRSVVLDGYTYTKQ